MGEGRRLSSALLPPEIRLELAAHLAQVRWIESLSVLLAVLGHEPLYEVVPGLAARPKAGDPGVAIVVGRTGDFPWLAVEGSQPARLARRVARRLTARGRVAGVLALDAAGRRLGVSVAFDG